MPVRNVVDGSELRALREAAGMSLAQLAGQVPYSRSALGHFETGRRSASAEVAAWYERACSPATDPVTMAAELGRADVERRSFLRGAVYSAAFSMTALVKPSELTRAIYVGPGRDVGVADVRAVRSITDAFLHADEIRGGQLGRTALGEFLASDVQAMLRARFKSPQVRQQAFSAASEVAYLAGWKAHDSGLNAIAERYYLAALRLAEESGAPGHDAYVLRILANQGVETGHRRFSVPVAEEAVSRAKGRVDHTTAALLQVTLARAHAETGNEKQARRTLASAQDAIDSEPGEIPRWVAMWSADNAELLNQAAKTFTALGEYAEASVYHHRAARLRSPRTQTRIHALTMVDAGQASWRTGDDTAATATWQQVIPALKQIRSARTTNALNSIRRHAPELVA